MRDGVLDVAPPRSAETSCNFCCDDSNVIAYQRWQTTCSSTSKTFFTFSAATNLSTSRRREFAQLNTALIMIFICSNCIHNILFMIEYILFYLLPRTPIFRTKRTTVSKSIPITTLSSMAREVHMADSTTKQFIGGVTILPQQWNDLNQVIIRMLITNQDLPLDIVSVVEAVEAVVVRLRGVMYIVTALPILGLRRHQRENQLCYGAGL